MTNEEKYEFLYQKVKVGKEKNDACFDCVEDLLKQIDVCEIGIDDAIAFAWAEGCLYGKEHSEDLKVFDK